MEGGVKGRYSKLLVGGLEPGVLYYQIWSGHFAAKDSGGAFKGEADGGLWEFFCRFVEIV